MEIILTLGQGFYLTKKGHKYRERSVDRCSRSSQPGVATDHTTPLQSEPDQKKADFPPKRSRNLEASHPDIWTENVTSLWTLARSRIINTRLCFMASEGQQRNGSDAYKEMLFREKLHHNSTMIHLT